MNGIKLHITLSFLMLFFIANAQQLENSSLYRLLSTNTEFEAGSEIVLSFSGVYKVMPRLYISNSYGTTLLDPEYDTLKVSFIVPQTFAKKAGIVHWKMISHKIALSGNFNIIPKKEVSALETYIGPPSINAGEVDYSMLVVIPTDSFDNPIANNTLVNTKHQFLQEQVTSQIYTKNLIAHQNIYAPKKSGRMLVASECLGRNSSEFTVDVMPAIPTNFEIFSERPHEYADGNQMTTLYTSTIKDAYNNLMADGTYVSFIITNGEGYILKTSGTTIKGVATAKMIHPDHQDQWKIKAFITGMAESNSIVLNYQQVLKDFEIAFSANHRKLTIGPLQSFMEQLIPDGLSVKISIYKNEELVDRLLKTSRKGYVNFYLKPDVIPNEVYTIKIETAGLVKTFKKKLL